MEEDAGRSIRGRALTFRAGGKDITRESATGVDKDTLALHRREGVPMAGEAMHSPADEAVVEALDQHWQAVQPRV